MESIYDRLDKKSEGKSSAKIYALLAVVVVLVSVIGFLLYGTYGGIIPQGEVVVGNADDASDIISELGNDLKDLTDDLKDIENIL